MTYLSFYRSLNLNKLKQEMTNKGPTEISLLILANGYNFFSKSFILQTKNEKYLFNCGENLVRCFKNSSKLKHIFLTRRDPKRFLGLPGFLTHLKSQGLNNITLHSPFSISSMRESMNFTLKTYGFYLKEHDYKNSSYKFKDENCSIDAIPLDNKTLAYLINVNPALPRLSIDKLEENQVPIGPLRRQLKDGNDVTLPNGKIIRASDVYDYSCSHNKISLLVLDLPSVDYIDTIRDDQKINDANIIVHMSDSSILNNDQYKKFIKLKSNIEHVILDENYKNIHSESMFRFQKSLNLIDDKVFPAIDKEFEDDSKGQYEAENVVYGISELKIAFRPSQYISKIDCPKLCTKEIILNSLIDLKKISDENENIEEIIANLHKEILRLRANLSPNPLRYPKINFLGTGSSLSTDVRNVSSILVNLSPETSILLDCGEGTLNQIRILFGQHQYEEELMKIKYIFISHHHSDHNLGIFNVLIERNRCFERRGIQPSKVYVSLPKDFIDFFHNWSNFIDLKLLQNNIHVLYNEWLLPSGFKIEDYNFLRKRKYNRNERAYNDLCEYLNLSNVDIVPVFHVADSSGIVITTNEETPFKLVFSGDSRSSETLINYGQNCDLLIHESTFADLFEDQAIKKRHSTIKEAIQISSQMNAKHLFLWHFSQRYTRLPDISGIDVMNKLSCSFDFMVVDRNEIDLTSKFNSIYGILFFDAQKELENKKRNKKVRLCE